MNEPMSDMPESVFEVLRTAVTLAKNEQISTVAALKKRLQGLFPAREADINHAISAWARFAQVNR